MDVSRSHRMSIQKLQKHTSRPISWQTIRGRLVHVEVVIAIGIRAELSSQIVIRLVFWILEIVFAVRRRLPDVNNGIWDSLASEQVNDFAVHQGGLAIGVWVLDDGSSILAERGIGRPEGTEDGGGGWVNTVLGYEFVSDFVDESVLISFYPDYERDLG